MKIFVLAKVDGQSHTKEKLFPLDGGGGNSSSRGQSSRYGAADLCALRKYAAVFLLLEVLRGLLVPSLSPPMRDGLAPEGAGRLWSRGLQNLGYRPSSRYHFSQRVQSASVVFVAPHP